MPIINLNSATAAAELTEYENFIATSPYGNMCQSVSWLDVKPNWNHDLVYLRDTAGKICAALTLLSISNDGGESSLVYARGPVCDLTDITLVKKLLAEANEVAKARNPFLVRLEPEFTYDEKLVETYRQAGFTFYDPVKNPSRFFINGAHTMIRHFNGASTEEVFASFSSRFRGKIRKSYKHGISTKFIRYGDAEYAAALVEMHRLVKEAQDRHGALTRPIEYFDTILRVFNDTCILLTHDAEGVNLSTCLLINYAGKSSYLYAGSTVEKRNLYPAAQTNWEAMQYAITQGMRSYDMGNVEGYSEEVPLYKFKRDLCGAAGAQPWIGALDFVFDETRYREFAKLLPEDAPVQLVTDLI